MCSLWKARRRDTTALQNVSPEPGQPLRPLPQIAILQDGINGNQHRINGNWIMNLSISLLL